MKYKFIPENTLNSHVIQIHVPKYKTQKYPAVLNEIQKEYNSFSLPFLPIFVCNMENTLNQ